MVDNAVVVAAVVVAVVVAAVVIAVVVAAVVIAVVVASVVVATVIFVAIVVVCFVVMTTCLVLAAKKERQRLTVIKIENWSQKANQHCKVILKFDRKGCF